jgi:uncharacterized protein (TIGR03437 family)
MLAAQDREREADDRQAARQAWFYNQRAYPLGRIPAGARLNAIRELQRIDAAAGRSPSRAFSTPRTSGIAPNSSTWTPIGPQPTQSGWLGVSVSGRVNAIAIDPRSDNTVYIGAAEGGVWKTTDGGMTWIPLTDGQASLASGAIALDPSNPDTVYVGTGEQNFSGDSYYGAGILKSTNAGATWTNIVGPFLRDHIGAIVVNTANSQIVFCASDAGVWRSSDGGQTWTKTLAGVATSLALDPGGPDSVYAAIGNVAGNLFGIDGSPNGVYHSTDGGLTWQALTGTGLPAANAGRIQIAMAPSQPTTIYAQIQDAPGTGTFGAYPWGSLLGIYKSTDGGNSWTDLTPAAELPALALYDYNNQLWYDSAIAVSPQNPDVVYAGAIEMICSLDGGQTWSFVLDSIHVDKHAFAFTQDGTLLYIGTDGGMYSTTDFAAATVNATSLNATLALTQFYPGIAIHPQNPEIALGGAQDNGTQLFGGAPEWIQTTCGDGGFTAIDPSFPSFGYVACQDIAILRTLDLNAAAQWIDATYGIDQTDPVAFIAPLVMDPANPQTLYFGTYRLWRSLDSSGIWYPVSADLTGGKQQGVLTAIAVAPSDSTTVYAGTSNSYVQATNNIQLGGQAAWTNQSAGLPQRAVTKITVDPIDAATAYVAFSGFATGSGPQGHVFMTTSGGASWTDVSGNLPNIPVNDLVVDPDIPNTLYIATDAGVMATTDGGNTWSSLGSGLPQVVVLSLVLHRPSRILRAATHGRSVWDILAPLPGATAQPSIASISPATTNAGDAAFQLAVAGSGFIPSTAVLWNGQSLPATVVDSSKLTVQIPASNIAQVGRASVLAFNPVSGGGASNATLFTIGPAPQTASNAFVSAANPSGGSALSPGSIGSLYGAHLAARAVAADLAPPLPEALGGTAMSINGQLAPLFFVSAGQINFQVPFMQGVNGPMQAPLTIQQGTQSTTVNVTLTPYSPALFTTDQSGTGQAAILIAGTASIAAPSGTFPGSRPAHMGEYISIFGTGLGNVSGYVYSGDPSPTNPLATTTATPTVSIGGAAAPVLFSGLAPGYVGLYQVNAQVPCTAPTGPAIPITLAIGGFASPIGDNFQVPPYAMGGLAGQTVGAAGFSGAWTQLEAQDLTITGSGAVGRPTVTAGSAGDYANFVAPITLNTGQIFISYNIANQLPSNLNSTRLDLNLDAVPVGGRRALIGAIGANANFNLTAESGLGTAATAQTSIASTGSHHVVAVLDATNHQIAMFVDPASNSFYKADGTNNADAIATWIPTVGLAFQSYSLIENQSDQVTFGGVVFSLNDSAALIPIASAIGAATSNTATIAVDVPPPSVSVCPK